MWVSWGVCLAGGLLVVVEDGEGVAHRENTCLPFPALAPLPHLPQLHAAGICPPLGNGAVTLAGCSPQKA